MAVEEVEATIIEADVLPLSGADKWLAETREKVQRVADGHHAYEISDSKELAQAKRERTEIRRDITDIDNERKALTRALDDAVKRFRTDVKDVLKPLTELDEAYKAEIDAYADRKVAEKRAMLEETFRECAPLMAEPSEDGRALVRFDTILERYGMGQLGDKWLNASTNIQKAKQQLIQALQQIQENEAIIRDTVAPDDVDVARAIYFDTLDMGGAIAEANNRARQRKRLEELERQRQEIEEWERQQRSRVMPEPIPAPVAEAKPEPIPEPAPVAPTPIPASAPEIPPVATDSWVFVGYCTESQAKAFTEWCAQNGITRFKAMPTNGRNFQLAVR